MNDDTRDAFLRVADTAVLSTIDGGGRIHSVPVWFRWDGECVRIVTARKSVKVRNLRRLGRASLCVDRRAGAMAYVTVEGPVEVLDPIPDGERLALWTHYRGEETARAVVARGGTEDQVLLVLRPERWLTAG